MTNSHESKNAPDLHLIRGAINFDESFATRGAQAGWTQTLKQLDKMVGRFK